MADKMTALVLTGYPKFELKEVPIPGISDTQVLVKVHAVAICGSDVAGCLGKTGRRIPPIIMGHEASGEIVALGKNVKGWECGQRVTFDSTEYCGECSFCRRGEINLCSNRRVLGVSCDEYHRNGAMAEYVAVESRTLYAIPDTVTYKEAALTEPLSIGFHAVAISPIKLGDKVLINGCGTIGLMALQSAAANGASRVIACDIDDFRLGIAKKMGATDVVNTSRDDLVRYVAAHTGGEGVDLAFDAVGLDATVNASILCLKKGGCLVCIGNTQPDVKFPLQYCVTRQIRIQGSCASSGEYDRCLAMIASRRVDLSPFLQTELPLFEGESAFNRLINREPSLMKVILTIDQ